MRRNFNSKIYQKSERGQKNILNDGKNQKAAYGRALAIGRFYHTRRRKGDASGKRVEGGRRRIAYKNMKGCRKSKLSKEGFPVVPVKNDFRSLSQTQLSDGTTSGENHMKSPTRRKSTHRLYSSLDLAVEFPSSHIAICPVFTTVSLGNRRRASAITRRCALFS